MRKVLTTGSFLVLALFGLYFMFAVFSTPSDVSTSETRPEEISSEGVGIAVAQPRSPMPVSYPVEDFTDDIAYRVVRVIDGDTVKIDYKAQRRMFG